MRNLESVVRENLVPPAAALFEKALKDYIVESRIDREKKDVIFVLKDGSKVSVAEDLLLGIMKSSFAYLTLIDPVYAERILVTALRVNMSRIVLRLKKNLDKQEGKSESK